MFRFLQTVNHLSIFHTNSHGYLLHSWSYNYIKSTITDLISKDIQGKPDVVLIDNLIHIYHTNSQNQLVYHVINSDDPNNGADSYVLFDKVNSKISPINVRKQQYHKSMYVVFANSENKLIEIEHQGKSDKIISTRCLVQMDFELIKCTLHREVQLLTYEIQTELYYFSLESPTSKDRNKIGRHLLTPKFMREDYVYELVNIDKEVNIIYINNQGVIMIGVINAEESQQTEGKMLGHKKIKTGSRFTVNSQGGKVIVSYLTEKGQAVVLTKQKNIKQWAEFSCMLEQQMNSLQQINYQSQKQLFAFLDDNEIPIFSQNVNNQLSKIHSLPTVIWSQIKLNCKPIGQQGFYGDCFFSSQLNLVVKKYRDPNHSFRVWKEVEILKILENVETKIVHHYLYESGVAVGFTLPFYKGHTWDYHLSQKNSIFKRSPVARIKLVLKLQEQLQKIHKINICHGDLHMQNILIDIDQSKQDDLLNPIFDVKVIDYGNGFLMQEGKTVSEGLTGWGFLIPPEVEFKYYRNYNPFGLNAYQFARNAFFILLMNTFDFMEKVKYQPIYQLDELQKRIEYPKELHSWLCGLVHYNIQTRNVALFRNMSFLEEQTRKLMQNQNKNDCS